MSKHLAEIRDVANSLLSELTGGGARMVAAVDRGRRDHLSSQEAPKALYAAGANIIAAQKKRWAKIRKAKKKSQRGDR